jgi:outer membrane receptor protein involved in Fe transport
VDITGYMPLRVQPGGVLQRYHSWDYAESLTWSKGRHVIKFGGEFRRVTSFSGTVPEGSYGQFTFNGSLSGYGYSDFLLGLPFSSQRLDPLVDRTRRDSELGIFVQDAFKVNNRLTLDLGLHWDGFGSPDYEDGLLFNWDPATSNVLVPENALDRISPLYPQSINVVAGRAAQRPSMRNFAPRIGPHGARGATTSSSAAAVASSTRRWAFSRGPRA